jgi:hypothetical protein
LFTSLPLPPQSRLEGREDNCCVQSKLNCPSRFDLEGFFIEEGKREQIKKNAREPPKLLYGDYLFTFYTNSINDCNTSLVQDAMNRVSTMSIYRILFSKWYYFLLFTS